MNKKSLFALIAFLMFIFVLIKVVVSQLCAPTSSNAVATVVSDAISTPAWSPVPVRPEPLSWDPIINQVIAFFTKACNR